MIAASQPQKSRRGWIFLFVRWAAAALILGVLLYLLPLAPLRSALSRVPLTRFLAVLLIYLVALTGGIAKWHTVVNAAGAQLKFAASAECYTSGLFGALFLPSIIGGDVARLAVGISRSPRLARIDSVTGIFARSATGASATCVDRRPSGRSRSFFYGADTEPATLAWPLDSLPPETRAAASCDTLRLAPSPPFARRLVARDFRAGHLYFAHGSSGNFLRAQPSIAGVALCVAARENRGGHADYAGWNRSSRSGAGGVARAVWGACLAGSRYRNCLGRHHHRGRASCRINGVPFAAGEFQPEALLTRQEQTQDDA